MAGLVPAVHVFVSNSKTWMPGHQGVTPVFDGLWPGMTKIREHVHG
jgi:hypothetical protein